MTNEIIYVTSQTDIVRGEAALNRLRENNDSRFQNSDGSITHVDTNRWEQAQQYERDTWMTHNPDATDDRNMTHSDAFGGYKALPKFLGDVIELGCGPFTNMRFILQDRSFGKVVLVDPLIDQYLKHNNCIYRPGTWLGDTAQTVNSAIEDYETDQTFDVVVMINVIHHCKDADAVLAKIRSLLNPGGYLVFHEPPREIDPLTHYDMGHPLSPTAAYLEAFIGKFAPIYREGWYFIGRKAVSEGYNMSHDYVEHSEDTKSFYGLPVVEVNTFPTEGTIVVGKELPGTPKKLAVAKKAAPVKKKTPVKRTSTHK